MTAEEIAERVIAMSDDEVSRYLDFHGLTPLVEPGRVARILASASMEPFRDDGSAPVVTQHPIAGIGQALEDGAAPVLDLSQLAGDPKIIRH